MKPADTLERLRRRWYIVLPGLVLAVAAAAGAWMTVGPEYERTGTQMLLPGSASLPEGETNPFFSIAGLQLPADVLVQAVSGQNALGQILAEYPGAEVVIERAQGSAPLVKTTVTSGDEAQVTQLLELLMTRNVDTLERLQVDEGVPAASRIAVTTLTVDTTSALRQRNRMLLAAVSGLGVAAATLLLASLVDGLARRRRRPIRSDDGGPARRQRPDDLLGPEAALDEDVVDDRDAETEPWPRMRTPVAPARGGQQTDGV